MHAAWPCYLLLCIETSCDETDTLAGVLTHCHFTHMKPILTNAVMNFINSSLILFFFFFFFKGNKIFKIFLFSKFKKLNKPLRLWKSPNPFQLSKIIAHLPRTSKLMDSFFLMWLLSFNSGKEMTRPQTNNLMSFLQNGASLWYTLGTAIWFHCLWGVILFVIAAVICRSFVHHLGPQAYHTTRTATVPTEMQCTTDLFWKHTTIGP